MISVSFYLHTPKARISPIYARVFPGDFRASTHISVEPKYWIKPPKGRRGAAVDVKKWVKSTHPYTEMFNDRLLDLKNKIWKVYFSAEAAGDDLVGINLQQIINPKLVTAPKEIELTLLDTFYDWQARYMLKKNKGNEVFEKKLEDADEKNALKWLQVRIAKTRTAKNTVKELSPLAGWNYTKGVREAARKLNEFQEGVKPKEITPELMEAFEEWVYSIYKVQDATILKYRKSLRVILKAAKLPVDWLEPGSAPQATKFSLSWEEVLQLRNTRYDNEQTKAVADLFVMNCQLCFRFGDLTKLKPVHFYQIPTVEHGNITVINKNQGKTGDPVLVPIPTTAAAILEEYGGVPRFGKKKDTNQIFNEEIKKAAAQANLKRMVRVTESHNGHVKEEQKPIHEVISSHVARHTGSSLMLQATRDPFLQKHLLGHTDRSTTSMYSHHDAPQIAVDLLEAWKKIEGK